MIFRFPYRENDNEELIQLRESEKIWFKYVDYEVDDEIENAISIHFKLHYFGEFSVYIVTHQTVLDIIAKYNLIKRDDISYTGLEYNTKSNDLFICIGN